MKNLIRNRTFRALCVLLAVAAPAATLLAQNGPPSKDRYIIVLKPPKNGVPELSDHDITAGGGKVEYKVPGRIQVTLPEPAVEAMRKQERVKYIQKVILGPLPDASAPAKLLMAPSTASLRATAESTPPTWRSGTYKYDASGNIYAIGLAGDTGSPVQHRYAYDELSRLKRADTMTTPTHTETFTYDVYGNLIEHVDGSSTTSTPVEDANTNRLKWSAAHPYTYDAAGNLTADYNASYAYDPVGMLREKDYTNEPAEYYIYTASDERIGVKYGSSSGSPTIWSIRDFSGNILRQYESHDQSPQMAWLWVEDYVYRDGQLLAAERVPEEGGRRHFHLDHLGSPRLVTGFDSKEMSEHDYKSFGLESNYQETAGGFDREDPKRFTGHERDYAPPGEPPASTAYLDYMHARFYSPNVGRFLSVDPARGKPYLPQSMNRYAYVSNNPLGYIDPYGQEPCTVTYKGKTFPSDCVTVTAKDPLFDLLSFSSQMMNGFHLSYLETRFSKRDTPSGFTKAQCVALAKVVQREQKSGTAAAAQQSSNTWGDRAFAPFMTDYGGRSNATLPGGTAFDIDWFTDINTYTGGLAGQNGPNGGLRAGAIPAYVLGKSAWFVMGGTDRGPFQDPGETAALNYALRGVTYAQLYEEACR